MPKKKASSKKIVTKDTRKEDSIKLRKMKSMPFSIGCDTHSWVFEYVIGKGTRRAYFHDFGGLMWKLTDVILKNKMEGSKDIAAAITEWKLGLRLVLDEVKQPTFQKYLTEITRKLDRVED